MPERGSADRPEVADRACTWPVLASRDIHRDDWVVALREDTVQRPGHPEDTFARLVLEHPGATVVLAVDEDERVCCLRQYRHAGGGDHIELPAGLLDKGDEHPELNGARELREEAQLQATEWTHLLTTNPSAGITTELHHIYLARGLNHADRGDFELQHEEAELEVLWVDFEDLLAAVLAGDVREGPLVQAVLAYDALKRRGRL